MKFSDIINEWREYASRRATERRRKTGRMPRYGSPEFFALVTPKGGNVAHSQKARRRKRNRMARASRKRNRR